tara:strand:+ start:53 stop:382 length:330 start_codon:yes stop_codon:yes gene_type:complete
LLIDQGTDFGESLIFYTDTTNTVRKDLTNYVFRGKCRYLHHSNDDDVVTFISDVSDPTQGVVNWALTDTQTAGMKPGKWVFDLEMEDGSGDVVRVIWGQLEIAPEATYG